MNRLWTVAFFTVILFIPLTYSSPVVREYSMELADTTPPGIDRIYGELIVDEIYEKVRDTNLRDIVQKVTENGSRYLEGGFPVHNGPNYDLRQYLIEQMDELSQGRLEIEIIGNYDNIVAKLPGYLPGEQPVFAVTAHYDSPDQSPGANTDGIGIAAVLTLVEVMSQYEWPLDIYFMVFNGLHPAAPSFFMEGSKETAIILRNRGLETLALYNVDTILFPHPSVPLDAQVQFGYDIGSYSLGRYWAELARAMSNNYGNDVILPVPSLNFALWPYSDHYAFAARGFSGALCAFESGYAVDDAYHDITDTWNNPTYRYDLGHEVTGAIGASMAFTMSKTYGKPQNLQYSLIIEEEDTERIYIQISTPTRLEISCRWYGGPATFTLYDPSDVAIGSRIYSSASAWEYTDLYDLQVSSQGLYTLAMENTGPESIGFVLNVTHNTDIDENGILDHNEFWLDSEYFSTDEDSDGLSAAMEVFLNTDDTSADSDGDTMDDKFEVDNGLDPTDPSDASRDEDGDGLTNAQEYSIGLNLFSADSDQDQMDDLWELENGLNPLFDDSMLDPDGDDRTNLQEYLEGTDPNVAEQEPIPIEWFIIPGVAIALIVGFLYYQRIKF
ncbi:MAG: M28 family peptidase [Candidatus Thorarchaeota archaeon]